MPTPQWTPPPDPGVPSPPGWWRRNLWAVLAIVPVLLVTAWLHYDDVKQRYWDTQPRVAAALDSDGWAAFGGGRVRLVELAVATDLKASGGKPYTPPAGVKAWRAKLEFEGINKEKAVGCQIILEDARGRTYKAHPDELNGARIPFETCTPDDKSSSSTYTVVAYYAMPEFATARAIRLIRATELPAFVRLTQGG